MDGQPGAAALSSPGPRVKASLVLGSESFAINSEFGTLSEQLAAVKEKSMAVLKEHIARHNAPNEVPDEAAEGESDSEGEAAACRQPAEET
uniref:Uncharacterized protein n=1 Tax=Zea mays TaxID=4577 RepID=B6T1U1_MAIZE|nr:hypothetical protein [Zea mays]